MGTAIAEAIDHQFAAPFGNIPEVESVYVSRAENHVCVSIFVNEEDDAVYEKIYDLEEAVESHGIAIDFRIIARRNRSMQDFVGMTPPAWVRVAEAERTS